MTFDPVKRELYPGSPKVSMMGVGTWAIGGPFFAGANWSLPPGHPLGYGKTDDAESIRALHCAFDEGVTLFDTADAYGTGHAERILGEALKDRRDEVLIATKFGKVCNEKTKEITGDDASPAYIRKACLASLERLQTDYIDLYQLHVGGLEIEKASEVTNALDLLVANGLIRSYAWSTDDPQRAAILAKKQNCNAVQFDMNVLKPAPDMVALCEREGLAALMRVPLAMGFLSGKYSTASSLPEDDIRSRPPEWLPWFGEGGVAAEEWSQRLDGIRDILKSDGRTLVQGALGYLWAKSDRAVPLPGIRTEAQARENAGAMAFGPLKDDEVMEIEALLVEGKKELVFA